MIWWDSSHASWSCSNIYWCNSVQVIKTNLFLWPTNHKHVTITPLYSAGLDTVVNLICSLLSISFLIGRSSLQSYDNCSVVVNKSSSIWGKVGVFLILVFEKYKHYSCCNGFLSGKWISKSQGLCLMDRISKIAINDSADLHMQRFVHVIAYCAWFDVQVEELRFLWS